jgi:hypothetical protein
VFCMRGHVYDEVSGKTRRLTLGGFGKDIFKVDGNATRPPLLVIPRF